jgi:DHA2 family multidrug resistance protein
MFFVFFGLFGSIVLLPVYLQTLMGYTSFLAGLALGPGGISTMIAMPIAGVLINKVNPKAILAFGIMIAAYSVHLMSQFNLFADFSAVLWPRVFLGVGMGFIFIPLTTLTMAGMRKEEMGNATAIFNLLRNLGGSFGVAFITTVLARRAQFHQARLIEHLTPFDRNLQQAMPQISELLRQKGFPSPLLDQGSLGVIQGELLRQAAMLSFNDAFYLLAIMMAVVLLFVPLMKKGEDDVPMSGMH